MKFKIIPVYYFFGNKKCYATVEAARKVANDFEVSTGIIGAIETRYSVEGINHAPFTSLKAAQKAIRNQKGE